jgi:hypothetical protein
MESQIHGACVAVPDFNALLNAPRPRFWLGDRVKYGKGFATVTGVEWVGCGSGGHAGMGLDWGWHYAVSLDAMHPGFMLEPVVYIHEEALPPVDSRHDVSTPVIQHRQICTTP